MKHSKIAIAMIIAGLSSSAFSIVINESVFRELGGDLTKPDDTYRIPYGKLAAQSMQKHFLAAGSVPGCGATWVGDTADQKSMYVLTASNCLGTNTSTTPLPSTNTFRPPSFPITIEFKNYRGEVVAKDGVYYKPYKETIPNMPSEDTLVLLKLNKLASISGSSTLSDIPQPVLNDKIDEVGKLTEFVGDGEWGINGLNRPTWRSESGSRRAMGGSTVLGYMNYPFLLEAGFEPLGNRMWARTAEGDNGSAWWQYEDGKPYIIGVTVKGTINRSFASNVGANSWWLRQVAPELKWRSTSYVSAKCWWLTYSRSQGKWVWADASWVPTKAECDRLNAWCNKGGACFKWALNP